MGGKAAEPGYGEGNEFLLRASAQVAHRRVDAAPPFRDLHVVEPCRPHFLLIGPWSPEDGVRMRIDQTGHEDPAPAVDPLVVCITTLEFIARTNRLDDSFGHRNRTIVERRQLPHFLTTARSGRPRARHQLRSVGEQERGRSECHQRR